MPKAGRPRKPRSQPLPVPPSWPKPPGPVSAQRPGEDDYAWFQRVLPELPKPPMGLERDDAVCEWMERVLIAGGPKLLAIAWEPINWPLSANMRGRNSHWFLILSRRGEAEAQQRRDEVAREQQRAAESARVAKLRAAGWA